MNPKIRLDDIRHVEIILTEMENSDFRKTGTRTTRAIKLLFKKSSKR